MQPDLNWHIVTWRAPNIGEKTMTITSNTFNSVKHVWNQSQCDWGVSLKSGSNDHHLLYLISHSLIQLDIYLVCAHLHALGTLSTFVENGFPFAFSNGLSTSVIFLIFWLWPLTFTRAWIISTLSSPNQSITIFITFFSLWLNHCFPPQWVTTSGWAVGCCPHNGGFLSAHGCVRPPARQPTAAHHGSTTGPPGLFWGPFCMVGYTYQPEPWTSATRGGPPPYTTIPSYPTTKNHQFKTFSGFSNAWAALAPQAFLGLQPHRISFKNTFDQGQPWTSTSYSSSEFVITSSLQISVNKKRKTSTSTSANASASTIKYKYKVPVLCPVAFLLFSDCLVDFHIFQQAFHLRAVLCSYHSTRNSNNTSTSTCTSTISTGFYTVAFCYIL